MAELKPFVMFTKVAKGAGYPSAPQAVEDARL